MDSGRDVRDAVGAENATSGEQLDELSARRIEPSHLNELRHVLVIVLRKEMEQLSRGGIQSRVPSATGSGSNARPVVSIRITCYGAGHCRPLTPQVPCDKSGQDAPSGSAVRRHTYIPKDANPGLAPLPDENALEPIVQMETLAPASGAGGRSVAARMSRAPFVLGEIMHVEDDQRAAAEAHPARVDQAWIWRRRTARARHDKYP